jgi:phage I-like protein
LEFTMTIESFSLAAEVEVEGSYLHVLPAPPAGSNKIKASDGRVFQVSDLAAVARRSPPLILLDRDHESERHGGSSAAYGWGDKLEVRATGLWMHTVFTPLGRQAIASKTYRWLSPVISLGENREVQELVSVAITNKPALTQLSAIGDLSAYRARAAERIACMRETGAIHSTGAEREALKKKLRCDDTELDAAEAYQAEMRAKFHREPLDPKDSSEAATLRRFMERGGTADEYAAAKAHQAEMRARYLGA